MRTTPTPSLLILVDLGDAHGAGKPEELPVRIKAGDLDVDNEYEAARDFIEAHVAAAYAANTQPVLDNNWLEEIARKVRESVAPVLATVKNLKAAMEAQN